MDELVTWHREESDILYAKLRSGLKIDLEVAKEMVKNRELYTQGKPYYIIMDFSGVSFVTREANDYMNSWEGGLKGVLGGVFLSQNTIGVLFSNLFLNLYKPPVPARFFSQKKDGISWIRKLKSSIQNS